jgi:hypothetical protein
MHYYPSRLASGVPFIKVTGQSVRHHLAIQYSVPFAAPAVGYVIRVEAGFA